MDKFLQVYYFDSKQRLGRDNDGGYVIADLNKASNTSLNTTLNTSLNTSLYDLYLGCGVNDDVSFDNAFAELYTNVIGFMFDGTISGVPPSKFGFVSKNIDIYNSANTTNLNEYLESRKDVFLKMDIEGYEWLWLYTLPEHLLSHIKQIVIEFHDLNNDNYCHYDIKIKVLEKLSKYFYLVHVHGNNHSSYEPGFIPNVIECTYVRKNAVEPLRLSKAALPSELDQPCNRDLIDIGLKYYPFQTNVVFCCVSDRPQISQYTFPIFVNYARKHNYDYLYDNKSLDTSRHISWSKIVLMYKLLKQTKTGDLIIWVDDDIVITRPDLPIESLLADFLHNDQKVIAVSEDIPPCYVNCGMVIIKNTAKTFELLELVYSNVTATNRFGGFWEQDAFTYLLQNNKDFKDSLMIYKPCILQGFVKPDAAERFRWKYGVFSAHVSGIPVEQRVLKLQELNKYFNIQ